MPEEVLNNLARIGMLDKVPFSAALLQKMLATAHTRLQDAQRTDNSTETRFDCAYTAIRAVADAALHAQGWRTSTSKPGHHQTAIQTLDQTLGVPKPDLIVLDALRRQRNVNDYEGDPIADATLHACLAAADKLLGHTLRWLQAQHPEWGLV